MRLLFRADRLALLLLAGLIPLAASATCFIEGHCSAELNGDQPEFGTWKYTLEVEWDSGSQHGLSHFDLDLGYEGHDCDCDEFPFDFPEPAGNSDGTGEGDRDDGDDDGGGDCPVPYEAEFECHGDPSIPGMDSPLLKFEPDEEDCEPGATGSGVFVFYSNWEPEPIDSINDRLAFKAGGETCSGPVDGELPTLGCEDVATDPSSWGDLKARF